MIRGTRSTRPDRNKEATVEPRGGGEPPMSPRSRRAFLRLMAAGGAAMLAAPAGAAVKTPVKKAAAADTTRMRRTRGGEPVPTNGVHPMLPAELEKQKKSTADSLKTLRNYALPPGSAPAYVFRPLAQKSRRRP